MKRIEDSRESRFDFMQKIDGMVQNAYDSIDDLDLFQYEIRKIADVARKSLYCQRDLKSIGYKSSKLIKTTISILAFVFFAIISISSYMAMDWFAGK